MKSVDVGGANAGFITANIREDWGIRESHTLFDPSEGEGALF
jgi:hypothetical protein